MQASKYIATDWHCALFQPEIDIAAGTSRIYQSNIAQNVSEKSINAVILSFIINQDCDALILFID